MVNHHLYKVGESKFHHNEDYWLFIMKKYLNMTIKIVSSNLYRV